MTKKIPQKVHMIGIGGIGMSALARFYLHEGIVVSGSDATKSDITETLKAEGAKVVYEQVAENITDEIDLVVYTEAMAEDHPELVAAREAGIETVNYFEALGRVANEYYLIAVAGTHGKTTTTAMLTDVLEEAGLDPTAIIGSLRSKTGSNFRAGKSKYAVVEACEYRRDFLTLEPDVLIITNLEHEHVDYYKDLADVQAAFHELAKKVPAEGVIIANVADLNVEPCLQDVEAQIIDYRETLDLNLQLTQPGIHNQMNAAAARSVARFLGVDDAVVKEALENFAGTWRRFQYRGEVNGAPVYDDYAHHPTEIAATLSGTREKFPDKKITAVFQPHTYTRTTELFNEFVTELTKADQMLLLPIYAAREKNESEVSSEQLMEAIKERGTNSQFFATHSDVIEYLKDTTRADDVILVLGAGDVTAVAGQLTM